MVLKYSTNFKIFKQTNVILIISCGHTYSSVLNDTTNEEVPSEVDTTNDENPTSTLKHSKHKKKGTEGST